MDDGNLAYRAVVLTDSKRVSQNIFREYESGVPVQKLSEKYQLSVPGIYKVIQRVRRQKEAMSLAMDCEANQIERI